MFFLLLVLACQDGKQWISEQYTPSYAARAQSNPARQMTLTKIAQGVDQPTDIRFPHNHSHMLVSEKKGTLLLFQKGENGGYSKKKVIAEVPVRSSSELGLLSIALHPDYMKNHRMYMYSTPKEGKMRGVLSEWTITDFDAWTLEFVRDIMEIEQPYGNHNGGQLQFGLDGMLYLSLGDGGWREDPHENGQNTKNVLGSIIRIHPTPNEETGYIIPKDNPFFGQEGFDAHIFVYGLRNPWRFSFAPSGSLLIADVGQYQYEEVSLAVAGDNLGWNQYEGTHCFISSCSLTEHRIPIWEYGHDLGTSITGGYIHSQGESSLFGQYIVGDFTSGRIWAMSLKGEARELGTYPILISTFGRDSQGNVYVADFGKGDIFRLDSR